MHFVLLILGDSINALVLLMINLTLNHLLHAVHVKNNVMLLKHDHKHVEHLLGQLYPIYKKREKIIINYYHSNFNRHHFFLNASQEITFSPNAGSFNKIS